MYPPCTFDWRHSVLRPVTPPSGSRAHRGYSKIYKRDSKECTQDVDFHNGISSARRRPALFAGLVGVLVCRWSRICQERLSFSVIYCWQIVQDEIHETGIGLFEANNLVRKVHVRFWVILGRLFARRIGRGVAETAGGPFPGIWCKLHPEFSWKLV